MKSVGEIISPGEHTNFEQLLDSLLAIRDEVRREVLANIEQGDKDWLNANAIRVAIVAEQFIAIKEEMRAAAYQLENPI